eukprot:6470061-Amphidinium_carterae.2
MQARLAERPDSVWRWSRLVRLLKRIRRLQRIFGQLGPFLRQVAEQSVRARLSGLDDDSRRQRSGCNSRPGKGAGREASGSGANSARPERNAAATAAGSHSSPSGSASSSSWEHC